MSRPRKNQNPSVRFESAPFLAEVGKRIRLRRQQLEMAQTDLAERIGVEKTGVSLYERGEVDMPLSRLAHIAVALDMPLTQLIADTDRAVEDAALIATIRQVFAEQLPEYERASEQRKQRAIEEINARGVEPDAVAAAMLRTVADERNAQKAYRDSKRQVAALTKYDDTPPPVE